MSLSRDLKVSEVAEALSMHPETVRTMVRSGDFPNAYKTGPRPSHPHRIPVTDVEDYRRKQPRSNR